MKRLIIIFVFFSGVSLMAQTPDSLFSKANRYFQKGNFEEAIHTYLEIDSLGYHSADLYYNTGNAYFRSNKLGKARLWYERAALLKPNDADIRNNLAYTESLLTDRFDDVPHIFFVRWYNNLVSTLAPGTWTLISLVFFFVSVAGFMIYIFTRKVRFRRLGFYTGVVVFMASMATLFFGFQRDRQINKPGTAIIMSPSQTVKSAPRQSGKDLFVLHEGTKVRMDNVLNGWDEITISDGRKGWIPSSSLEEI
ncbi:MAG TPA: tetratricopeptide repeat protein [Bacteroidales bacterium]|nr:tetratricopeptide repeat protein [Bacteroidales bacterium]